MHATAGEQADPVADRDTEVHRGLDGVTVEALPIAFEFAQVDHCAFDCQVRIEAVTRVGLVAVIAVAEAVLIRFHVGHAGTHVKPSVIRNGAKGSKGEQGCSKVFSEFHLST
ncbi:hypothetical protein D9M71_591040 [compost metagenome]